MVKKENVNRLFSLLDANGDGSIELDELKNIFDYKEKECSSSEERAWAFVMAQVDADDDGTISKEEF